MSAVRALPRPNKMSQRRRAADLARDAFLRTAAVLTEPLSVDNVAFALLEASIGMCRLAECDDEQNARSRLETRLREAMAQPPGGAKR